MNGDSTTRAVHSYSRFVRWNRILHSVLRWRDRALPPRPHILPSTTYSPAQVDTDAAVKEFEEALAAFDATKLGEELGVPKDMVEVRATFDFSTILQAAVATDVSQKQCR